MANRGSKAGKLSVRNPSRDCHGFPQDGQVDILREYDTRYPDLRSRRSFSGNGSHPENPFGGELAESPYPYTRVKNDDFSQPKKVSNKTVKSGKSASGDY